MEKRCCRDSGYHRHRRLHRQQEPDTRKMKLPCSSEIAFRDQSSQGFGAATKRQTNASLPDAVHCACGSARGVAGCVPVSPPDPQAAVCLRGISVTLPGPPYGQRALRAHSMRPRVLRAPPAFAPAVQQASGLVFELIFELVFGLVFEPPLGLPSELPFEQSWMSASPPPQLPVHF